MAIDIASRLKHAWNAFFNKDPTYYHDIGSGYSYRPDRPRLTRGNEKTIVNSVYNRIALDVAAVDIMHVRLDENGRYLESIDSGLNNCLTLEANIDQTGRDFIHDVVMSMLDEGCVAVVPIDTNIKPNAGGAFDILTMRTGKILEWYPQHVRVRVYNERTGQKSSSGKLDLIIQLPYVIKTEARRKQAENRRKDLEQQLEGSKYGIAYTDGTERITQLNRPVENTLMSQVEYLTSMLYSQLGITQAIMDGTADEKTMLNYYNRTIEPFLSAIVDGMKRTFLTKTARSIF